MKGTTTTSFAIAMLALLMMAGSAKAVPTALYVGTQYNMTQWRTSSVDKPYDPDGNDVIGSVGWHLFGAAGERTTPVNGNNGFLASLPAYITVTRNTTSEVQYPYAFIDNPVDNSPLSILSGTTDGSSGIIATITFGAGVPTSLTMSLMHDNLNGTQYNTGGFTVRASNGTTILATTPGPSNNNQPDWHFINLTGLTAGDSIQVWENPASSAGNETLGAITFDAPAPAVSVPEPSSLALMCLAGLGVLRRRRAKIA